MNCVSGMLEGRAERKSLDVMVALRGREERCQAAQGWKVEKSLTVQDLLMLKASMIPAEYRRT